MSITPILHVDLYEADFVCPEGHEFTTYVSNDACGSRAPCPTCYAMWVAANIPHGRQIDDPRRIMPKEMQL